VTRAGELVVVPDRVATAGGAAQQAGEEMAGRPTLGDRQPAAPDRPEPGGAGEGVRIGIELAQDR
jgi:hypothetical protein